MKNPKPLLRASVIGTVLLALCCFTPILVILLHRWPGGTDRLPGRGTASCPGLLHRPDPLCAMAREAIRRLL